MELQGTLLLRTFFLHSFGFLHVLILWFVTTEVNAGPAAIMTIFLKDKKDSMDSKYVKQLTQDFANLIQVRHSTVLHFY